MRGRLTILRYFCVLLLCALPSARGDEQLRQAQEELRRRNLYFGDIDGKPTPDLANALRRYQARKGFPPTGTINRETAASLNIESAPAAASESPLPDIPVLKSDRAPELPESERIALEKKTEANPDFLPSPQPPAEPPPNDIKPQRIRNFIEKYLRDGETDNVAAQTECFAYPVDYFSYGKQGPDYVRRDVISYLKDWPERHYTLEEPITFFAADNPGEVTVEFPITYHVQNRGRRESGKRYDLTGRTKNIWTLRLEGDQLKIVAINEQRLRE